MRADRLLSILLILQNEHKLTTKELAEKLEVSERTILRDMDALSSAGVPVYAERGRDGGWMLSGNYRTSLTGLKMEEFLSLLISSHPKLLTDLGFKLHFDAAFQKLLASSPSSIRQHTEMIRKKIHIDGTGWHSSNETNPFLPLVQEAVWQERKLFFAYKRDREPVERTVHPLGLVAKQSVWYMVAEIDGEFRTYRISKMLHAIMLEESFTPPANFDLALYWEQSTKRFKQNLPSYPARLNVWKHRLDRLKQERYVKVLHTDPEENGWIPAEVEFETLDSACEITLSYGGCVKVVAPAELRDKVMSEAQSVLALYSDRKQLNR